MQSISVFESTTSRLNYMIKNVPEIDPKHSTLNIFPAIVGMTRWPRAWLPTSRVYELILEHTLMTDYINEYCNFFTATNLEWKKLLLRDIYKDIIIGSMRHLVKNKRVIVYGFVIMPNHIYLL